MPLARPGVPSVQQAVINDLVVFSRGEQVAADIAARERVGLQRYGTPLQPHNGRSMLRDAYDEALDLATYLRGALIERDQGEADELVVLYDRALNLAIALRAVL